MFAKSSRDHGIRSTDFDNESNEPTISVADLEAFAEEKKESIPRTYEDWQDWVAQKSREYGSRNKFTSSEEYRLAYPEIMESYKNKQDEMVELGKTALESVGQDFGDHVYFDVVSPFGDIEKREGVIIEDKYGKPVVRLDNSRKTV